MDSAPIYWSARPVQVSNSIFFGFFGSFPDAFSSGDLLHFGEELTGRHPAVTPGAADAPPACIWSDDVASTDDVTIALQGDAVWTEGRNGKATGNSILEEYRRTGPALLESLHGSYTLAIVDRRRRQLILAIDPMGIGRLAYSTAGHGIVFSNSAMAVARFPSVRAGLDHQSIFDYLLHHVVPSPATIFNNVRKLPPATHLTVRDGTARLERHWTPRFAQRSDESFETLAAGLSSSLREAVRSCTPGSTTGAFLSGGLDSSTVAGVLTEVQGAPARTFTIGFGYADYDELPFSRIVNAKFGCRAHEYVIRGEDITATFHRIAQAYDEPFGNASALPAYHCAVMAREAGVDHLLAGDGGDELFAGNSRYADQQVFEWYRLLPVTLRERLLEPVLDHWPQKQPTWLVRKARGYVQKAKTGLPARLEAWNFMVALGPDTILHPDFLATVNVEAPFMRMQQVWDSAPAHSTLQRMLFYDWQYTLADNDLRKVETMCALAGVRVSYPMLDHRVIDLATRIPPDIMMPGRKLRDFYKRAMTGFLPDEIISKKKHGFGLPFGLWLQESPELRDLIFGSLASLRNRQLVRPEFLDRLLHLHGSEDARYYGVFIWVLAMLEQWLEEHGFSR